MNPKIINDLNPPSGERRVWLEGKTIITQIDSLTKCNSMSGKDRKKREGTKSLATIGISKTCHMKPRI